MTPTCQHTLTKGAIRGHGVQGLPQRGIRAAAGGGRDLAAAVPHLHKILGHALPGVLPRNHPDVALALGGDADLHDKD